MVLRDDRRIQHNREFRLLQPFFVRRVRHAPCKRLNRRRHVHLHAADFVLRFGAVIPLDDIEYAVLLEMEDNPDGEEQVLVTRIEPTDDGGMTFVVEENPQKVEQVFNSYVNLRTQEGLTGLTDAEG